MKSALDSVYTAAAAAFPASLGTQRPNSAHGGAPGILAVTAL